MQRAWDLIAKYRAANALNPRKGYRLGDVPDLGVLQYLAGEVTELLLAPTDADELADVLGCLFHYAQRLGVPMDELERRVCHKLVMRHELPDQTDTSPAWDY